MQPNFDLQSDTEALYVDGIGHIAQYHHYIDKLWSHGVIYFVRDYLFREIEARLEAGARPKSVRHLVDRLNTLNSKIRAHESEQCR